MSTWDLMHIRIVHLSRLPMLNCGRDLSSPSSWCIGNKRATNLSVALRVVCRHSSKSMRGKQGAAAPQGRALRVSPLDEPLSSTTALLSCCQHYTRKAPLTPGALLHHDANMPKEIATVRQQVRSSHKIHQSRWSGSDLLRQESPPSKEQLLSERSMVETPFIASSVSHLIDRLNPAP